MSATRKKRRLRPQAKQMIKRSILCCGMMVAVIILSIMLFSSLRSTLLLQSGYEKSKQELIELENQLNSLKQQKQLLIESGLKPVNSRQQYKIEKKAETIYVLPPLED